MKQLIKEHLLKILWGRVDRQIIAQNPCVITLTGSVGKTSTKDAIALVLAQSGRPVLKTQGNLNTEIGVPLTILGFKEQPSGLAWLKVLWRRKGQVLNNPYYVLEFSADKPGDIAYLTSHITANAAVLTCITPVHMQFYDNFTQLVTEKQAIVTNIMKNGYIVINKDDSNQKNLISRQRESVLYGIDNADKSQAGVWAENIQSAKSGLAFTLHLRCGGKMDSFTTQTKNSSIPIQSQVIGRHQLYSLLAAAAVGYKEGLSLEQIKKALEDYTVPNGRGKLIQGKRNITIIDDSYNASPEAVKAGLDMLKPFAGHRRTLAVLGNMNELGDAADIAHQEVAAYAAKKVDYLIVVGPRYKLMQAAAEAAGQKHIDIIGFETPEQLFTGIEQLIQSKDVIYIKGSQNGVRLERLVKLLMANPKQADKLLVRQGRAWK